MAPSTRSSKRAKNTAASTSASGIIYDGTLEYNNKGLSAFPDEIYLEIASQIPAMPLPMPGRPVPYAKRRSTLSRRILSKAEEEAYQARHQTLASLAQTCRALRRVFLRYLWQRIEVFDGMVVQRPDGTMIHLPAREGRDEGGPNYYKNKMHALELTRQLEVVTVRDVDLAQYVNVLNVLVLDYSVKTIMPELARAMTLLPNLHTVQLVASVSWRHYEIVHDIWSRYTFPQIRDLCVYGPTTRLIQACPNLRRLAMYKEQYLQLPGTGTSGEILLDRCPSLEEVGRCVLSQMFFSILSSGTLPNLRKITLGANSFRHNDSMDYKEVAPAFQKTKLQTIRLFLENPVAWGYAPDKTLTINWAKSLLDHCVAHRRQEVRQGNGILANIILIAEDGTVLIMELVLDAGNPVWYEKSASRSEGWTSWSAPEI